MYLICELFDLSLFEMSTRKLNHIEILVVICINHGVDSKSLFVGAHTSKLKNSLLLINTYKI